MSIATHSIELEWKSFSVNLDKVNAWMKNNAKDCCGISAGQKLTVHFTSEPHEDETAAIELYWEAMHAEADEAKEYVSQADQEAARAAKKESGKAKLLALGLTADEVAAIVG